MVMYPLQGWLLCWPVLLDQGRGQRRRRCFRVHTPDRRKPSIPARSAAISCGIGEEQDVSRMSAELVDLILDCITDPIRSFVGRRCR